MEGDVQGVMGRPDGEGADVEAEQQKWYTTTPSAPCLCSESSAQRDRSRDLALRENNY